MTDHTGERVTGAERIAAERQRQVDVEGWTPEHDDEHNRREMLRAADAYMAVVLGHGYAHDLWPEEWDESWFKYDQNDPIRNLEKAGALIAAEIDRLLRASLSGSSEAQP